METSEIRRLEAAMNTGRKDRTMRTPLSIAEENTLDKARAVRDITNNFDTIAEGVGDVLKRLEAIAETLEGIDTNLERIEGRNLERIEP